MEPNLCAWAQSNQAVRKYHSYQVSSVSLAISTPTCHTHRFQLHLALLQQGTHPLAENEIGVLFLGPDSHLLAVFLLDKCLDLSVAVFHL